MEVAEEYSKKHWAKESEFLWQDSKLSGIGVYHDAMGSPSKILLRD